MACKTCKQKKIEIESDNFKRKSDLVAKGVVIFAIVWTIFAIYGLYNFICDIVSLIKYIL